VMNVMIDLQENEGEKIHRNSKKIVQIFDV
jgi:hypothetical protein